MALGKGNKVFVYLTEKSSVFIIIYSVNGSNILYFSELMMFIYVYSYEHSCPNFLPWKCFFIIMYSLLPVVLNKISSSKNRFHSI